MMYKDAEMITGGVFDCQCNETFTLIRADQSLYRFLGYTQKAVSYTHLDANHTGTIKDAIHDGYETARSI